MYDASDKSHEEENSLRCLKCSKDEEFNVSTEKCPCCLGIMEEGELDVREKYFGIDYLYHAVRIYRCVECDFTGVADEQDQ